MTERHRQRIIDIDKLIGKQKLHYNEGRLNFEAASRHRLLRHHFGPDLPGLPPTSNLEKPWDKFLKEAYEKDKRNKKSRVKQRRV
jgi:hypothetical protein